MKTLLLGGGCFWCTEAIFNLVGGVTEVEPGYAGGKTPNPTYERICSGNTGHAEVIRVRYDENKISTETLLRIFFETHDPTTLNRQGNDVGTQYRSVIYCEEPSQMQTAKKLMEELNKSGAFQSPIVTQVESAKKFFRAEKYHLNYYRDNPDKMYCMAVINPKIKKFIGKFHGRITTKL